MDLHGDLQNGGGARLNDLFGGLRVAFKPPTSSFRPYLQGSIGVGSTRQSFNPVYLSTVEYQVAGGVDKTLSPHVDFRVLQVGVGKLRTVRDVLPNLAPGSSSTVLSFSTGIVIRIR